MVQGVIIIIAGGVIVANIEGFGGESAVLGNIHSSTC